MHGQHIYREFTYLVDVQHCGCYQKCSILCTFLLIQIYTSVLGSNLLYTFYGAKSTANLNVKIRTAVLLQFFEVEEIYLWLDIKHHKNQMNFHYVYLNLSFT